MTIIYLVRHGQASFGAENYDQLSALGQQQAQVTGQYLQQLIPESPYLLAGGLQRHLQTAQAASSPHWQQIQLQQDQRWNEFNHEQIFSRFDPRFEQPDLLKQEIAQVGEPREYLAKIFTSAIERWTQSTDSTEYDETWLNFQQRVQQALSQLTVQLSHTGQRHAVVFTSGGVISVAVGYVLGLNAKQIFELNWAVANASITTLRVSEQKLQLLSFNEHHFLKTHQGKLVTWL